jgi:protocatechuate 3,4-dioxygenase beta subunit
MRFGSLACAICLVASTSLHAADSKPVPAPAPAPPPAAEKPVPAKPITGTVKGPDGKAVAGATVRVIPMPPKNEGSRRGPRIDVAKAAVTKTDASGTFKLEGTGRGPFAVRVELPGAAPAGAVDVPAGAALDLRLKRGTVVVGRVLDLTTQKAVAGATVTALERDAARFGNDAAHVAKTGEDGTFQIADCAPGIVAIEAIAPGKARARLDGVVAKLKAQDDEPKPDANTLFLQPGGRIAGRVLGPDGKPLAEAVVTASPSDGSLFSILKEGRGAQRTDADGKFSFDGIQAGNRYTVRATKEGLSSQDEGPIAFEAGTDRGDLELKLDAGANLRFRLVTAQDAPVHDVEARLQQQGGSRRRGFAGGANNVDHDKIVAEGDGKFLIKSLDAGTFDVTLEPPDYADIAREGVKLRSGETTDLGTLRVKESKSIAGRVTDTNGQPIAGAVISGLWLAGDARLSREALSKDDGRFKLAGLGDEPLRNLSVRATGYTQASREGAIPGDTAVDFTLEKTGSIVGRVQFEGGAIPPAFRVQAFPEAKEKQERPGFRMVFSFGPNDDKIYTDPSGRFRLDDVDAGMVTITAKADGKAPGRKSGLKVVADQVADAGTLILEDGRALRGRVVAAKDDAPIPGVTVSLSQPQGFMTSSSRDAAGVAISGLDGRFEISGLEPRTYAVDATQPDYSPSSGRVEIGADADTDDFVVKLSRGGIITGLVRDAQKAIVPNVQVLLTSRGMGGPQTVSTGPDGRYTFEKMAPGDYIVMRAPSGGGPLMLFGGMKQVTVREGETTTFDLDELSKINLTGRVLKGGQPVANAMLFFANTDPAASQKDFRRSQTDAEGRYQVGLDAAGTYSVVLAGGGKMIVSRQSGISIQVPDQPNPVIDVTVKAAGISGRVMNTEGKPVSDAIVMVRSAASAGGDGHGSGGSQDQSEPDGTFLIDGLEPGTYTLTASAAGYRTAELPPVTIASDSDVPAVDVRLEAGRTVRGRVVDANGNGIAEATVMAAASGSVPSGMGFGARSDVNGTFLITAPADGPIDVTAVAAGFPPARAIGVQPEGGEDVVLHAPRPGRVRVSVRDSQGNVVPNASVSCRAVPDYLGYLSMFNTPPRTGPDGTATVSSLAPGAYEVTVSVGSKRASTSTTLTEGSEVVTNFTLP